MENVEFQKQSTPAPIERHWEFLGEGGGSLKAIILKGKYEAKM